MCIFCLSSQFDGNVWYILGFFICKTILTEFPIFDGACYFWLTVQLFLVIVMIYWIDRLRIFFNLFSLSDFQSFD